MKKYWFLKIIFLISFCMYFSNCSDIGTPLQNKSESKLLLQSNIETLGKLNFPSNSNTSFRYVEDEKNERYLEVLEGTTVMLRIKRGESLSEFISKNSSNKLKLGQNGSPLLSPTLNYEWHPDAPLIDAVIYPTENNPVPNRPNLNSIDYNDFFKHLDKVTEKGGNLDLIETLKGLNNSK